jgi:FMN-dependent oxidoreductase (nitrilotriacetate monooxygenase family)
MKKMMHLNGFVIFSPMNHSVGSWLHPDSQVAGKFAQPDLWQDIARTLERGKFDALFFADTLAAFGNYRNRMDEALAHAIQFPAHDPTLLIPMLAAVTERLGYAVTLSLTYNEPYRAVRMLSTLDHLTKGRIGWNIVTSAHVAEAVNLGYEKMVPHRERYQRADEYMQVCHKLWNSWEPDAVVANKQTGVFVDPTKIHPINHKGKWFSCPGISAVEPSPQGHPVLFQAGASPDGRDFCAKYAEAAFGVQLTTRALKSFADDMAKRLRQNHRDPASFKYIWGIQTIIGGTEEEARRKQREFNELVPYEGGLALLSGHSNHDLSQYDLDEPIEDIEVEGIQGLLDIFTKMYKAGDLGKDKLTMREVGKIYGATIGCPQLVGTPEQVADQMEKIIDETGGDGFNITPSVVPKNFTEFVDEVVPELQRRGRHRREYTGSTLRDHLTQDVCG